MRNKNFKIPGDKIIPLKGGCLATDKITVEGLPVGFMYREEPNFDGDSGWRIFSRQRVRPIQQTVILFSVPQL